MNQKNGNWPINLIKSRNLTRDITQFTYFFRVFLSVYPDIKELSKHINSRMIDRSIEGCENNKFDKKMTQKKFPQL